jgi:acetyl-CoA carboxylase biotin carboxyl carrier protein
VNYKEIKELIDLMQATDVAEIEVERSGTRIRIRRREKEGPVAEVRKAPPPPPAPEQVREEAPPAAPEVDGEVLRAPLVGTFYRSPGPDTKPYVEVGDRVEKGQVLCIIEAMKLMNEIEAEYPGVIREALAENGQPVEYGQPLFRIAPEV